MPDQCLNFNSSSNNIYFLESIFLLFLEIEVYLVFSFVKPLLFKLLVYSTERNTWIVITNVLIKYVR